MPEECVGDDWNAAALTCPEQERHKKRALACNFPAISPREVMKVYDQSWQCPCLSPRKR